MGWVPITLITGPANSGKARVLLDALRAHLARGSEPLLIVPTGADVEHYRGELAAGGLVLGARVEHFRGLLEELGRRTARHERTLSPLARERVLAAVLAQRSSAGPARDAVPLTPGFVRALAAFVAELEVERVTPARLSEALKAWTALEPGRAPRAGQLAGLFADYHRVLGRLGRSDPEQRAVRALDVVRREPSLWGSTPVLFYGFDDLTRLQLDTIETLGAVVQAPVMVALAYEPGRLAFGGRAAAFQTLLPIAAEHRSLEPHSEHYAPAAREALHQLERSLFEPDYVRVSSSQVVRLLEGGGERAELELVAGEIRALLDRGVEPTEIAIVHRAPGAIAELLGEVLTAAQIPFSLERRLPFAHTAIGRALLGLLASALGGRAGLPPGELGDLLAWLRAPGLLERPELADRLEAQARRAGIGDSSAARALWEAEHWPLETIDHLCEAAERGPRALLQRVVRELEWLFNAPRRGTAKVLEGAELDEARALVQGKRVLEELDELGRGAPELTPTAVELVAILQGLELVSPSSQASAGPVTLEVPTVAVLDPLALRARRVRALFLCGLQEGVFPASHRPEPFLAEVERRRLAEASGLSLQRHTDALAVERYLLYATVSRPEELLVLSWHMADDDGTPTAPSLFLEDVCDLFEPSLRSERRVRPLGAAEWPGPGAPPVTWAEREGALAGPREDPHLIAPLRDPELLAELDEDRLWSASALELWVGCPVRWLVERLLRATDLEPEPEPLARGALAHAVLKETLEGLRRESGSARLTLAQLSRARELLREALRAQAPKFPLSVAPERVPGARRRLEADLERYLEHAARNESPLEPAHLELSFGFPEEPNGVGALDLGEGVKVRGRIDRVDVGAGGAAVVYDYKGARALDAGKWAQEGNFQVALYMRVVEQQLGRRAVGGFYQPLSSRDLRARGLLDAEGGVELAAVNGDLREHAEFEALLEEALQAAREAAGEARGGALEPRPNSCGYQGGCLYPTICRCER